MCVCVWTKRKRSHIYHPYIFINMICYSIIYIIQYTRKYYYNITLHIFFYSSTVKRYFSLEKKTNYNRNTIKHVHDSGANGILYRSKGDWCASFAEKIEYNNITLYVTMITVTDCCIQHNYNGNNTI